jgi:hypothetical protein
MNQHKDLPSGSQAWAKEVDALMEEVKRLREVVRRLSENAGLDFSNPQRGLNSGSAPSTNNPVGQKLSSLADVQTYNVADKQYLSWSQKDQKWLPATLPTATGGGAIEIPMAYSSSLTGYGQIESPFGFYAYTGTNPGGDSELWGTNGTYVGAGDWAGEDSYGYALLALERDGFSRPHIQASAFDYIGGGFSSYTLSTFSFRVDGAYIVGMRCTTADRPTGLGTGDQRRGAQVFDRDLGIPIWWNGTTWVNALGTAV